MEINNVKNDIMDSGLGSDEDRGKTRTKEQKQLRNQQLLSGCFIDAASLSDESEQVAAAEHRRKDERRQGALIFQSSIPQFSMLQITDPQQQQDEESCSNSIHNNYGSTQCMGNFPPETNTPYNSIVHLDMDEEEPETARKSPLGFYVDLSDVPVPASKTPPSSSAKKNIFSMVIDFEAPKKDKPTKLSSSYISKKSKAQNKTGLLGKCNSGSLSSSVSSINSTKDGCKASTSRQKESDDEEIKQNSNLVVTSASLVKNLSLSSSKSSSSSSEMIKSNENILQEGDMKEIENNFNNDIVLNENFLDTDKDVAEDSEKKINTIQTDAPQFVKLSDLECQKPRLDINFTPRMSRSIPESSWVESPLFMSRSAGYRSAPHPLEPENSELSDSSDSNIAISQPKRSVRRLGTDLLRMFLEEIGPDVVVEVEGHKLKAHKCILASRCQYFAALLSGNWLEASGNVISLQGFSYESVYFSLCHIYSGAAHVPDSISLVELASLADMLGLEGLKEVVEHALKQRHCHNFHRPCAGCCTGVLEVLPLSAAYGLDDLYQKCLQWITQHFVRVWPSRAFASLPRELREKCYQQHVVHMTPDRVLETITSCDKILTALPSMRWAEPVSQLVVQLADACHLYHRQHFAAVLTSPSFLALDQAGEISVITIEEQVLSAAKNLGVEQACKSYTRCCKMLEQGNWNRSFGDLLNRIKIQLEQCLVSQADRLIRSNAWLRLDTSLRQRIKELTPTIEPASRLPRATSSTKTKKYVNSKSSTSNSFVSSSESSRNTSPSVNSTRLNNSTGSPSLRRSLLLAARQPQVPPSPSTHRRSTLTQPTAASAAKSAATTSKKPNNTRIIPSKTTNNQSLTKSTSLKQQKPAQKKPTVARNQSVKKDNIGLRPDSSSRASSPLKTDSRTSSPRKFDSRVTSPIKIDSKSNSPRKTSKTANSEKVTEEKTAKIQRSGTFLKDEPTVLGKVI